MSPELFQDIKDGYIKPYDPYGSLLVVEHSVVVTIAGSQSRRSQIESYG